jgi:dCTP deaminase
MIEPFTDRQVREGVISYGVSSYGYDIRVADEFRIFTNVNTTIVDPKNFDPRSWSNSKASLHRSPELLCSRALCRIFPHPAQRADVCVGKSTYARCGIIVNVTPFEPEWEGYVTLEISNTTPLPAKSTPTKDFARSSFFDPTRTAKSATKTKRASTSRRAASSSRVCSPADQR